MTSHVRMVIHACTAPDRAEVLATGEIVTFYPPARVGLRAWKGGKPNSKGRILWAQQDIHPRDWLH